MSLGNVIPLIKLTSKQRKYYNQISNRFFSLSFNEVQIWGKKKGVSANTTKKINKQQRQNPHLYLEKMSPSTIFLSKI